jgi:hypothetical protein
VKFKIGRFLPAKMKLSCGDDAGQLKFRLVSIEYRSPKIEIAGTAPEKVLAILRRPFLHNSVQNADAATAYKLFDVVDEEAVGGD